MVLPSYRSRLRVSLFLLPGGRCSLSPGPGRPVAAGWWCPAFSAYAMSALDSQIILPQNEEKELLKCLLLYSDLVWKDCLMAWLLICKRTVSFNSFQSQNHTSTLKKTDWGTRLLTHRLSPVQTEIHFVIYRPLPPLASSSPPNCSASNLEKVGI